MLALASSALSLPAQQQKLAIAPDNSTAPLPELLDTAASHSS